jgi:uncharacterized lipoprotein
MKLFSLPLLGFIIILTGCNSVNDYVKTRKSQYLYSQDLGNLRMPTGLKTEQTNYVIPAPVGGRPTQLPNFYPPTDEE